MHEDHTPRGNTNQTSIDAERERVAAIIGRLLARQWLRIKNAAPVNRPRLSKGMRPG